MSDALTAFSSLNLIHTTKKRLHAKKLFVAAFHPELAFGGVPVAYPREGLINFPASQRRTGSS